MKTVTELLELVGKAIQKTNYFSDIRQPETETRYNVFFIDFSGHVNQIDISFYSVYDGITGENSIVDRCKGYLDNENHIQELYYFLKNRL